MHYLIAYDIADPKRLRRVARFMERRATRCQKSVFLARGDAASIAALIDEVRPLLKPAEDVVQAWRLSDNETADGLVAGTPQHIQPAGVVLGAAGTLFVDTPARRDALSRRAPSTNGSRSQE